jgi:hypothetical protein
VNDDISARQRMYAALEAMQEDPACKITKNAVAVKAGVNNANLYKKNHKWIILKEKIEEAELVRKQEIENQQLRKKVEKLEKQVLALKKLRSEVSTEKVDDSEWMSALTEMYAMNANLQETVVNMQADLVRGSEFRMIRADPQSGEVIDGVFDK